MHSKIATLYQGCSHSKHSVKLDADEPNKSSFKKVLNAFNKAIKEVHNSKGFKAEDLKKKPIKGLIDATNEVLKNAVEEGITAAMPAAMLEKLQSDVFVFSGMKTYTQLKEASLLLTNESGLLRPLDEFTKEVQKINSKYNANYLAAERRYAIDTASAAESWQHYYKDKDVFDLKYLTDSGPNVRETHRAMEGIVLPMDDPFWRKYFPPNDWNCHCFTVRIEKGSLPQTNSDVAMASGDAATVRIDKDGKNAAEMFRMNAGMQGVIFPPKHPYYPQHCNGAKLNVSRLIGFATWLLEAEGDRCKAKKIAEAMNKNNSVTKKRESYVKAMQPLLNKNVSRYVGNDKKIKITFSKKGNSHIAEDVLNKTTGIEKKDLPNLHKLLKEAEYIRSSDLYKERKDDIRRFYYFKDKDKDVYYNVAEVAKKRKYGQVKLERFLYAVTNEIPTK